jgi:hypothetical protein
MVEEQYETVYDVEAARVAEEQCLLHLQTVTAVKSAGAGWWPRVSMPCTIRGKRKEREYIGKGIKLVRSIFTVDFM